VTPNSLLSQLQISKAKMNDSPDNEEAIIDKEMKEKAIIDFEHLAGMIEEDRKYREAAIKLLRRAHSSEDFLKNADIDVLRAWVMEITIFSLQDYEIHWFNDLYTVIGDGEKLKAETEMKRSSFVVGDPILKPAIKKKNYMLEENYDEGAVFLKDSPVLKSRGDSVQAVEVEDYSLSLEDKIRKEIRTIKQQGNEPSFNKQRIGVYARVSTDDPQQLGSLEAQMAYYTFTVLKNPEYRLIQVYYDEGISGTKAENRPGFQQMIADCKKGKIDRIVTKSISRFARNTVDCLEYVRELKSMGISIFFEKEEIDSADNEGEILLIVYSALAQEESRSLGESLSWGKRKMAERGDIKVQVLPYGYVYSKDQKWTIDEEKANIIRRIYNEYILGISMQKISKKLTDEGVPSPGEKDVWNQTTVSKMLKNQAYKGELIYQKEYIYDTISKKRMKNNGELPQYYIENHHEAIIDKDLWNKVQDIISSKQRNLKTNKSDTGKTNGREEFYKVFLCERCDCLVMHIPELRRNEKHYWRCRAAAKRDRSDHCNEKGIREENIEHTFMVMLQDMKDSKNLIKLVNEAIECIKLKPNENEILDWLRTEIENRYQSLYDIVEEGKKHGEDTEAIKIMSDQIMELHDRIRTLEDRKEKVQDMKKELKWLRKELLTLTTFDPKKERIPFRGDIFSRLVKAGMFHPDGVIEYTLSLGIKWIAKDNRELFWKLPLKAE
jgi:site-specific DNA recombinase